jgi:hypothetical protein
MAKDRKTLTDADIVSRRRGGGRSGQGAAGDADAPRAGDSDAPHAGDGDAGARKPAPKAGTDRTGDKAGRGDDGD